MVETQVRPERTLRLLASTAASVEKLRVGMGNRNSALERDVDEAEGPVPEVFAQIKERMVGIEDLIDGYIKGELTAYPVWTAWLSHVKGISYTLGGQMLAFLLPPRPQDDVGSWFKAAGLAPQFIESQGQWRLPRPRAGEGKVTYFPYLRRCLFNVAESFVKVGGFYKDHYYTFKDRLIDRHLGDTNWPPIRLHRVAQWLTVKLFLSHLFEEYCRTLGFEAPRPYAIDILGHNGYIPVPQWDERQKI